MRQRSFTACVVSAVALILCICACAESASAPARLYVARRTKLPADTEKICGPVFSPTAIVTQADGVSKVVTMRPDGSKLSTTAFEQRGSFHCSRNGRYGVWSTFAWDEDGRPTEDQRKYTFYELPSMKRLWTKEGLPAFPYVSNDGNMVVFANGGHNPYIIDFHDKSGNLLKRIGPSGPQAFNPFAFDSNVPLFAAGRDDGTVTVYNPQGDVLGSIKLEWGMAIHLYMSPNGTRIAGSSPVPSGGSVLFLLNSKCELVYEERIPDAAVVAVIFSPDGKHFARRMLAGLELRDGATGRMIWDYELEDLGPIDGEHQWVGDIAVDSSGQRVALVRSAGSNYGTIIRDQILLLDQSGKLIASTELSPRKSVSEAIRSSSITFSADGSELIVPRKSEIEYYRVEEARH